MFTVQEVPVHYWHFNYSILHVLPFFHSCLAGLIRIFVKDCTLSELLCFAAFFRQCLHLISCYTISPGQITPEGLGCLIWWGYHFSIRLSPFGGTTIINKSGCINPGWHPRLSTMDGTCLVLLQMFDLQRSRPVPQKSSPWGGKQTGKMCYKWQIVATIVPTTILSSPHYSPLGVKTKAP